MIIQSLLDTDLYKFTQQQAVLQLYPDAEVTYRFKNRGNQVLGERVLERLQEELASISEVSLTQDEFDYLNDLRFLKPGYLAYLKNYRFDPNQVHAWLENGSLALKISGPWVETILWEVPLMAMISQIYFEENGDDLSNAQAQAQNKARRLDHKCHFADFGTRRRRSLAVHRDVVGGLMVADTFTGTSNVLLAKEFGLRPIGTMAHEFIMGVSALESLRHANRYALRKWKEVYTGDLGIALTDTFGSTAFWKDFDRELAKVYDGVRHDSGDPIEFGHAAIAHYESLGIEPSGKKIVFSDGLNVKKALKIAEAFADVVTPFFGIGTHFTNDFASPALNMVIKLRTVNDIPVVKLSDEPGKETGQDCAVGVAKWIFGRD